MHGVLLRTPSSLDETWKRRVATSVLSSLTDARCQRYTIHASLLIVFHIIIVSISQASTVFITRHHHHHVRVAGEGRCVTPVPWPRRMADLHNVEGMLLVSLRIWSTHLLFGRPGRRFQSRPGRWPSDRSTWTRRAWWAGTSSPSLAVWPKIAIRRLASCSPTERETSVWWDSCVADVVSPADT